MKEAKSVSMVLQSGLCISCGVCQEACPSRAIKMVHYSNNSTFPKVDPEACEKCGKCLDVCYGFGIDQKPSTKLVDGFQRSVNGEASNSYIGYATDPKIRFNSTSGGIVTAILKNALEQGLIEGAIVTRMKTGKAPKAEAFIARTPDEISSAQGSKYHPVSFAECLKSVDDHERYAVVGLPCHIYGIRKLAEAQKRFADSIRFFIGIMCGGMPNSLGTQYLLKIYGMEKRYIEKFEYRGAGWPGRLLISSDSDEPKEVTVPYPNYWRGAFKYFQPYRCTVCHDGFNEFSDISCGDAWSPKLIRRNNQGFSLIMTRTKMGEQLLPSAPLKKCIELNLIKKDCVSTMQQGILKYKQEGLKVRLDLARLTRRQIPRFDYRRVYVSQRPTHFLRALDLLVGRTLASREGLGSLLEAYLLLKRKVGWS